MSKIERNYKNRKKYLKSIERIKMNTLKSSQSKLTGIKLKQNPLKLFSDSHSSDKKQLELIAKIAEPFISYKSQLSHQMQINIAGYKTVGSYSNSQKVKSNSEEYTISKQSIQKYLFTFCFEIGCDLPTQEEMKLIYTLLLAHSTIGNSISDLIDSQIQQNEYTSKPSQVSSKINTSESIKKSSLYLLIRLCLQIYVKSKKSNIGGILERLIIAIRKQIEFQDDAKLKSKQNQKNQHQTPPF